ncbi:hypothetical protein [Gorillibacterium massiliense]|uniref:hypothetical protein n=1 Tax=Gorillibacterium massiliense TaxID=1280390 RepID=UPI0004BC5F3F|nr:hypothetical protein [Gorillibacterium massiliense]
MGQRIGNIGVLNLIHATEESITGIEHVDNVGIALYRKETAHLLTKLNLGNIGKSLEIPEGYRIEMGSLHVDAGYLASLGDGEQKVFCVGKVVIGKDVTAEQLETSRLCIECGGKVYVPAHLAGMYSRVVSGGKAAVYESALPRWENGVFRLSNGFLDSLDEPVELEINGKLELDEDLRLEQAAEKIRKLSVNGVAVLRESQKTFFYRVTPSVGTCKVKLIPDGYIALEKPLRLNAKSLRRFKGSRLYTTEPIFFDPDVTREAFAGAFERIQSNSLLVGGEAIEDLLYECCPSFEAEVLGYEHGYVWVQDEETWTAQQFQALTQPTDMIVTGKLVLAADVIGETLQGNVASVSLIGDIVVQGVETQVALQPYLRKLGGNLAVESEREDQPFLHNIGVLNL